MNIKLGNVLKHSTFSETKILAGKKGLNGIVNRVSVFDCPVPDDLHEQNIIEKGDLFISGLLQFKNDKEGLGEFIDVLLEERCSGLLVLLNDYSSILTADILKKCEDNKFPVIQIDENIPYAYVMDAINRYLSIENLNAINELKIEKLMKTKMNEVEMIELVHSINSNVEKCIQIVFIRGELKSTLFSDELSIEYLNMQNDIFINSKHKKIYIASSTSEESLKKHVSVGLSRITGLFVDPIMGASRIKLLSEIDKALNEANIALKAAKTMGVGYKEYDPLSSSQLLISMKDSKELDEFYNAFVNKIIRVTGAENLNDTMRIIETYVINQGDFKKAGKILNQHENTVRYRINKVREALEMENDPISFHELLSIITKISHLRH